MPVPDMLSQNEMRSLKYRCNEKKGGRFLELGCWLGGSTLAMLPHAGHLISVDNFRWATNYMDRLHPGKYQYNDTFILEYIENIGGFHENHTILPNGVERMPHFTEPFDLVFVDGHKNYQGSLISFRKWLACLRPGALIMDQDFCWSAWAYAPNYMVYYRIREYTEFVQQVDNMVIFKIVKRIPQEVANQVTQIQCGRDNEEYVDAIAFYGGMIGVERPFS